MVDSVVPGPIVSGSEVAVALEDAHAEIEKAVKTNM
jgi:hypothetical protein